MKQLPKPQPICPKCVKSDPLYIEEQLTGLY